MERDPEARRRWDDGVADHAVPGRGREAGRPDRDSARGHDHRLRHPGRPAEAAAAREGRVRGAAAHPRGSVPLRRRKAGLTMTPHVLSDAGVMLDRSIKHVTRSLDTII